MTGRVVEAHRTGRERLGAHREHRDITPDHSLMDESRKSIRSRLRCEPAEASRRIGSGCIDEDAVQVPGNVQTLAK